MKNKLPFFFLSFFLLNVSTFAQVEIDRNITLTGSEDSDRAITNLALPINGTDAVNKDYVDNAVSAGGSGGCSLAVGDEYQGGVIAHVFKDANGDEHGLIFSVVDIVAPRTWSATSNTLIGGLNNWDGLANSQAIATQNSNSAANDCLNYSYSGYSDWYLPTQEELRVVYAGIGQINGTLVRLSGLGYRPTRSELWTSLEHVDSAEHAYFVRLSDGVTTINYKNTIEGVRCVRVF